MAATATTDRRSGARTGLPPLHAFIVPFPIACFVGVLLTDFAYVQTTNYIWTTFSIWLLTVGCITGGLAAVAGLYDFVGNRGDIRATSAVWVHAGGNALALGLGIANAFVHSRDGWTTVVPDGLTLSVLTVLILLVTAPLGKFVARRQLMTVAGAGR